MKFGIIAGISCMLMAALSAAMFVVSYESLASMAVLHGVSPNVAWIWPISLDGLMVLVNLVRMRASLEGVQDKRSTITMACATIASIALNVVHAPTGDIVGQVMFAIPPAVLWVSSELTMAEVRGIVIKRNKLLASRARAAARKAASKPVV